MLLSLPAELLSAIALEVVASQTAPGPPQLLALLLTHPRLAAALSLKNNTHLYAQILHLTFDTSAVRRRFGRAAITTTSTAAADLVARWECLRRIRRGGQGRLPLAGSPEIDRQVEQDLLHVWLMLTENDGTTLPHVLGWRSVPTCAPSSPAARSLTHSTVFSDLPRFTARFQAARVLPDAVRPGFPADSVAKALHIQLEDWFAELGQQVSAQSGWRMSAS